MALSGPRRTFGRRKKRETKQMVKPIAHVIGNHLFLGRTPLPALPWRAREAWGGRSRCRDPWPPAPTPNTIPAREAPRK